MFSMKNENEMKEKRIFYDMNFDDLQVINNEKKFGQSFLCG